VHDTDSRYCAGKAALGHTLAEDMHISFLIEDYREELERKISESMA
jgi:shikimate kinase